jgi:death-on-curing protein
VKEPLILSEADVLWLHRSGLEKHGGMDGVRDPVGLASALHSPEAVWFYARGDLFEPAAAYAFHLAQNQPFVDGNKRAGIPRDQRRQHVTLP